MTVSWRRSASVRGRGAAGPAGETALPVRSQWLPSAATALNSLSRDPAEAKLAQVIIGQITEHV